MHFSPINMQQSTLVCVHKTINCCNCCNYLIEITKKMLALAIRLLLTFYWLRAIKSFFNMHVYATQSQKPASIIASTTTFTAFGLLKLMNLHKILTKITKLQDPHLLQETGN